MAAVAVALGACARPAERAAVPGGELAVEWSAPDSSIGRGAWRGRAEAGWCEAERRLTLFATSGDTGAAVLVVIPALAPARDVPLAPATDSSVATRATVALRWPRERLVQALASGSGSLTLERTAPVLDGRFEGTRSPKDTTLAPPTVHGRFTGVTGATGEAGCRLAGVGPPAAAGVP